MTGGACQLLLLGILIWSPAADAQSAQDSDSARVLALETLWNQAEVAKDAAALDHLLAHDFTFVDIDGLLQNKVEFLDSIKHPAEHIEIIGNDSVKARVYRDTVIVNGTYHEKGTLNGKAYVRHGRFTDTWVRQGSSWMCVASHSTLMQR
ncbi:MAG: nuclear transport factor 2 family protein [Terriglobales bacterium]